MAMTKIALYLAGGGARGAYQAGVLKAIQEILACKEIPFTILSGVSVGCLNAAIIGQHANDFAAGTAHLEQLWQNIQSSKIFNASNFELSKSVARNLANLFIKNNPNNHLLDTSPLHDFIEEYIDFEAISRNIADGHLQTMEIISHCYDTQQTISFYQHHTSFEDWHYPQHSSRRVELSKQHILASSALPLFFPPAKIDNLHYGDGSMGLIAPLRGAIRFEVDKILILGTRPLPTFSSAEIKKSEEIGFARVLGSMLNGLFLDNLDHHIEMVNHMNEIARLLSLWKKRYSPWRPISTFHLRPSVNIAHLAQQQYHVMPSFLRFLLNILGARSHSGDLLSFLLFEKEFTRELLQLGYEDTIRAKESVLEFFEA